MSQNKSKFVKSAAILSLVGMLCGCGTIPFTQKAPNFDSTYTINAEITYDKLKAKANLTRMENNEWEFKFTEPKQLNGLSVKLNQNGYSASLGGLSFSAENNSGYINAPRLIASAVGKLSDAANSISTSDGVLTINEELDGNRFIITANERGGELISLKCPSRRLSVNFSEQKPYTQTLPEDGGVTITAE